MTAVGVDDGKPQIPPINTGPQPEIFLQKIARFAQKTKPTNGSASFEIFCLNQSQHRGHGSLQSVPIGAICGQNTNPASQS